MTVAGASSTAYAYDKNNRLLTETKTAGTNTETTNYSYDDNGNQISKTTETLKPTDAAETESLEVLTADDNAGSSGITLNEYNGFNQLVKTTSDGTTATYTYNGDGLRTSKIVNGTVTNHIWDGDQIALETDSTGNVINKYVRGINLLYAENTAGTKQYYLFNGHGDVVQLTGTDGSVTKNYDYDAFGNEKNPDANDSNVFRYCGEYFDKETGTIYLRARYYDPEVGRFISEDSYTGKDADPLSLNLYTYCYNNPVFFADPSGHWLSAAEVASTLGDYVEAAAKTGEFIIEAGVTGYTVLKRATPAGVAIWVLFTPTDTATTADEQAAIKQWASKHKKDISPKPPKPPKPTLAERILQITAASQAIKDNIKDWGLEAYSDMTILLKNTGLQAHHIIEKRFAPLLGIENTNNMYSMALTPQQHQLFTNAWRTAFPYGTTPANMRVVYEKALEIYKDFPEITKIIDKAMELQKLKYEDEI